ncbi:hypothetical protein JCM13591A_20090 [Microbacterium xylanilyticum]
MLSSRECRACGEVHLVQRNGLMSIHTNAHGERCVEPPLHLPATLPPSELRARRDAERAAARRTERADAQRANRRARPLTSHVDEEREAAFSLANEKRRGTPPPASPLDRRIYAVPGAISVTSGGLPGTNRSH